MVPRNLRPKIAEVPVQEDSANTSALMIAVSYSDSSIGEQSNQVTPCVAGMRSASRTIT
jgi:hypothetical protein